MAQIGSFVPAQYASIRLVDKIFTRIGTQESIDDNSISFVVRAVGFTSGLQQLSGAHLLFVAILGRPVHRWQLLKRPMLHVLCSERHCSRCQLRYDAGLDLHNPVADVPPPSQSCV